MRRKVIYCQFCDYPFRGDLPLFCLLPSSFCLIYVAIVPTLGAQCFVVVGLTSRECFFAFLIAEKAGVS
jgi:hypothetical protein